MNERGVALAVLDEITGRGGYNNLALSKALARFPDERRESRAFVTECVNGTLRRLLTLDYVISHISKTPLKSMDRQVLNLLRLSVYQLMYMDKVPAHAVCDEAVGLAAESGFGYFRGFVNGVLRNIARQLPEINDSIIKLSDTAPDKYMEVKYSVPKELAQALAGYLGQADTTAFLEHINETRPEVTVCVNTNKTTPSALTVMLEREGVAVSRGLFAEGALRIRGLGNVTELAAFRDGLFHIMDEGAMLAVMAAGIKPGDRVLDVCAAPGGKAFLAAYFAKDGFVDAGDKHEHRVKLIAAGAERLGIGNVRARLRDAEVPDKDSELYDVVMADVPCTGLGLLGKKPDIRYNFTMEQVSKLQGTQRRILNGCAALVKPGGTLLYSTCTLTPEENEKNAAWIVKTLGFDNACPMTTLPRGAEAGQQGWIRVLPHKTGTDGFFIARFIKHG